VKRFRARGNGLELSVVEWSAPAPRATCVLLHGFVDAAASFDLVAPALASSGLRVIAPDLRGFGESDRVRGGGYYHFPDYVADLDALVAKLAPDPFFLVGHSMGGTVATLFAGARAERVAKLAVLEGLGPPDHPAEAAPVRMTRWLDDLAAPAKARAMTDEDALRRLAIAHPGVPRDVLATRLPRLYDSEARGWRHDPMHRTTSPMPFFASAFRAFAARVACPVLYVSGGPLGWRVPDEAERLAAFANVTHVDLEGAGHMMHWTAPAALASALSTFFRE
jgi:pimeloyl-ACP methyl ester carboxylesterase